MTQIAPAPSGFAALQERLGPAWAANRLDSSVPHLMVALPSYSVAEALLAHYGERIAPLEHRYLVACLSLPRIAGCEMVFVTWTGMAPASVIGAVDDAKLTFDRARATGVVLHMLSCLAIDGRFGLTAIGDSPEEAADFYEATRTVVDARSR